MNVTLTHPSYDGVCSLLLGNGSLCTTVGPTGYHAAPDEMRDTAPRTQHFVWAARRLDGPGHPLRNFGSVSRALHIDGHRSSDETWTQTLDCRTGTCISNLQHGPVAENTTSVICLTRNIVLIETELTASRASDIVFDVVYALPLPTYGGRAPEITPDAVLVRFDEPDNTGNVRILSANRGGMPPDVSVTASAVRFRHAAHLAPGRPLTIRTLIQVSDRLDYSFPSCIAEWDSLREDHRRAWAEFWSRSDVRTGHDVVDRARIVSLYTIRAQLTDWSIGPTLSEPYWGGGAFHDEMYPFFALISGNHPDLASRMPRFRLMTLDRALQRGRGAGALYPWSSTEVGEERDPDGLWLTERFHLAQFSAEIWAQWLYRRDRRQLAELYPVLDGVARCFENTVIVAEAGGAVGTRACVDFDESVGAVRNGPFTVSGAASALRWAAEAAETLGMADEVTRRRRALAESLTQAIVEHVTEEGEAVFGIPDAAPLHYSVLGHVFPFRTEVRSHRARQTAKMIHAALQSTRGWKPGLSSAFEGSNWQWAAGHLGIVHAMQNNPELAWDAVTRGPEGSGPGLIPCEHLNAAGVPQVPWFTTGVGAWTYALHACLSWVDEHATHLLGGVPDRWDGLTFHGIAGSHGIVLSGTFDHGAPLIAALAPEPVARWRFAVPARYVAGLKIGAPVAARTDTEVIFETDIPAHEPVTLVAPQP